MEDDHDARVYLLGRRAKVVSRYVSTRPPALYKLAASLSRHLARVAVSSLSLSTHMGNQSSQQISRRNVDGGIGKDGGEGLTVPPGECCVEDEGGSSTIGNVVKARCWLCVNQQKFIYGNISMVNHLVIFEPNPEDKFVKEEGILAYQFCLDARDISDAIEVSHVNQVINATGGGMEVGGVRAKRGGGMTYLQLFWEHQKSEWSRSRDSNRTGSGQQTLFLVRKARVEMLVNTIKFWLEEMAKAKVNFSGRLGLDLGKSDSLPHLTKGPIASRLGNISPTKMFQIASDARGGSPSPPRPHIGMRKILGLSSIDFTETESHVKNTPRQQVLHTPLFIGGNSKILSTENALNIESCLPHGQRGYNWQMSYSSSIHGLNWATFYRCCERTGPNILCLKTTKGEIIGSFASETWCPSGEYIGTGESFVFRIGLDECFETFAWTMKDSFIMLSTANTLVMGAGGGFAFRLDQHFKGYSTACETFGTVGPLTKSENFDVFELEVYCFISGNSVDRSRCAESFDWDR